MPKDKPWENGYSKLFQKPDQMNQLTSLLKTMLQQQSGLLKYVTPTDILHINDSGTFHCPGGCGSIVCLWQANQHSVQNDNDIINPTSTNKEKRFFSYKQFSYILHGHLGKGNRKELPKCVVEGVRALYPDEKGQYVGYKPE